MSFRTELEKWIGALKRRVHNLVVKTILESIDDSSNFHVCKVTADFPKDKLERHEPYGLTSLPEKEAETVVLNLNGDTNQGLIIQIGHSKYNLISKESGDVVLYSKGNNKVHMRASGNIEIETDSEIKLGQSNLKKLIKETAADEFNNHVHNVNITAFGVYSTSKPAKLVGTIPISSVGGVAVTFDCRIQSSDITTKVKAE